MRLARAVSGVLGSGVVVIPALLAGRPGPVVAVLALLVAATMLLAAALFHWRPFGGHVRSVRELPAIPRGIYSVGFLGGSGYFLASAAAVLRAVWQLPAWAAALAVALALGALGQLLARRPLPAAVIGVRCLLALGVAMALPLTGRPAEALGPAAGQLPLLVLALASLLVCVGWEALPALGLGRAGSLTAAVICAVAGAGASVWAGVTGTPAGSPGTQWDAPVGAVLVGLLILFAAGNTVALAAFWHAGAARSGLRTGQLGAAAAVIAACATLQVTGVDRGWILLAPGVATLTLYTGFALRRWPVAADCTASANTRRATPVISASLSGAAEASARCDGPRAKFGVPGDVTAELLSAHAEPTEGA